ncbi:uncharacterized protein LOC114945327 [Nylanderia fulva]|uniref:uncharacterized protein LOC114945327 n=1 Tax=Nylanderia fulva TaxID=613905 RepID=UPI0010FB7315|nr:uncharacterized protein LOC114945327 [Nylanderia fulva]XP_029177313.1 uncharacterized protein LOC114945327 [Nylanderia fulva]XP_029177314.1 uncharacterized protein LOC114945327 [Nylanderia fulva]XP_029177315.1 uncharacterized protein LOC114945327 [Nylanderia fulva]XP_029177316.1 uncharacterized protein LOC114945327 [Nylanderia fulva]XP_029177317.1 uncharacterized protein LOC114945327 [Nylanderia fulva]XP_029177318.1 uncharacterized protein LOC114945327 [Nylanderia fulva]
MAIPFLPRDENPQTPEERLMQILMHLQDVLRSRNAHHPSRNHRAPRNPEAQQPPLVIFLQPGGSSEDLSNLPLPDLVQSAVDQLPPPQVTVSVPNSPMRDATFQFPECNSGGAPLPSPRPRPRRRFASESSVMEAGPLEVSSCNNGSSCCCLILNERQSWSSIGANLRNIAGDFHACRTKDAEIEKSRLPVIGPGLSNGRNSNSSSTDSLLSLLIPTPLRETLWATVALYLGWRLVSRLR